MLDREIILKTTVHIPVTFEDENGVGIDHSVGSRVTRLRLTPDGSTTVSYTLDTDSSAEFLWDSQADGTGWWLFESDATYTAGTYKASVVYLDPSQAPDGVHLLGEAIYTLRNPNTGAIS